MAKKQQVSRQGTIVSVFYPTLGKRVSIDYAILSDEMKLQAGLHGLGQKLGDAASGCSPEEKHEMASRIVSNLREGNWELTATPVDNTAIVCEALARIKGGKFEDGKLTLKVKGKPVTFTPSKEQAATWSTNSKVKLEIQRIKLERLEKAAEEATEIEIDI